MGKQEFNVMKMLKNIWRHIWIIVLVAVIAGGTAFMFTASKPSLHEATTTILIGNTQQKLSAVSSGSQGGLQMTYVQDIGSQIEVLVSRGVLEQAIIKLEPQKANDTEYIQAEVLKLQASIGIQQVKNTNVVALTVYSEDPILARQQANAIANAYIIEAARATTAMIESSLLDTTKRLADLQKSNVDLSISPTLPKMTAQINTALPALQTASKRLQKIVTDQKVGPVSGNNTATIITKAQLSTAIQRMNAVVSDTLELATMARNIKPVNYSTDMTARSISIAVVEGRVRALTTKIDSLSTDISTLLAAETDSKVQELLLAVRDDLQVAGATGSVILEQVTAMYKVQEQYQTPTTDPEEITHKTAILTDANLLNRIYQHSDIITENVNSALEKAQKITPRDTSMTQWRLSILSNQFEEDLSSVTASLQNIYQKLQAQKTGGDILVSHEELSVMEIGARTLAINLNSMLSQLVNAQSGEFDLQVNTMLIGVKDSLNIAYDAVQSIGSEIAEISISGGDNASYSALDALRQQLQLALLSSDTSGTRIVDTAVTSPADSVFTRYKNVLIAVIAGILLSILVVLIIQYFDRIVRDTSQVKHLLAIPPMASIDAVANGNVRMPSILNGETPQYLESFRLLRTNLGLDSAKGKVLLVSSPEKQEGKTTVAANLARVVALQGRKVLLIDGNLRHPNLSKIFGLVEGEGLTEMLSHEDITKDRITKVDGVNILPSGAATTQGAELFASPRLKALLEKYRQNYDVIILDSAPVIGWTDTRILAKNADGVLLVLQPDASKLVLAVESKQALEASGTHVEGFTLNRAPIVKK